MIEEINDLWNAMKKKTTYGHPGANTGRIFDGQIFVTSKEWAAINDSPMSEIRIDDRTKIERLQSIPMQILPNGESYDLNDGRLLVAFADNLYVLEEFTVPALPRLHLDGREVITTDWNME